MMESLLHSSIAEETADEIQALQDLQSRAEIASAILFGTTKVVAPLGLLINVIFLYVVGRMRSIHAVVNVYLANVAVADTIFLSLALSLTPLRIGCPRNSTVNCFGIRSVSTPIKATLASSVAFTSTLASLCFITALAFERFYLILRPLKFRSRSSKIRAGLVSMVLWAVTIALGIIHGFCKQTARAWEFSVFAVILYVTILSVNIFLCIWITKALHRQKSALTLRKNRGRVDRAMVMLILTTAVLFLFNIMLPIWHIANLVVFESGLSGLDLIGALNYYIDTTVSAVILTIIKSSIDPLVYGATNFALYRGAFAKAFCLQNLAQCFRRNGKTRERHGEMIKMRDMSEKATYERYSS